MKIAVTSTGPTLEDAVGTECRGNEYLLLVELSTMDYVALINPALIMVLSGSAAAEVMTQLLVEQNVKALLANECSTYILKCLADSEIQAVLGMSGSAHAAVQEFKGMSPFSNSGLAGHATTNVGGAVH